MSTNERAAVRDKYEAVCEDIFSAWLGGTLSPDGLGGGLTVEHCPEPYLDFSPGDPGIVWVTHNPGRGERFQGREVVDTAASPLSGSETYADNSRRLAAWYASHGRLKISSAAQARIAAMHRLGSELGVPGLRQV